jgi:hypothetical protein
MEDAQYERKAITEIPDYKAFENIATDSTPIGCRRAAQLPHEALHAGVLFAEAVAVHQILPDGRVPTLPGGRTGMPAAYKLRRFRGGCVYASFNPS